MLQRDGADAGLHVTGTSLGDWALGGLGLSHAATPTRDAPADTPPPIHSPHPFGATRKVPLPLPVPPPDEADDFGGGVPGLDDGCSPLLPGRYSVRRCVHASILVYATICFIYFTIYLIFLPHIFM